MKIRFYIDPETDRPHIYCHDVSEEEVEEILQSPSEDRPGKEDSRVTIGKTTEGRYLQVIYVSDSLFFHPIQAEICCGSSFPFLA